MQRSHNIWYLRVWQRSLRDFFVVATHEGEHETVFFITDNADYLRMLGPLDACPDLRMLLAVPTAKISPKVRAEIRAALKDSPQSKTALCGCRMELGGGRQFCGDGVCAIAQA
jgi:hypothetical protein